MTPFEKRARQIAREYDYHAEALHFQYQRRAFGSFTTTLDGSPEQRRLYSRAWSIALHRERAMQGKGWDGRYPRIYAGLKYLGLSPAKAIEVIIDASRGHSHAMMFVRMAKDTARRAR